MNEDDGPSLLDSQDFVDRVNETVDGIVEKKDSEEIMKRYEDAPDVVKGAIEFALVLHSGVRGALWIIVATIFLIPALIDLLVEDAEEAIDEAAREVRDAIEAYFEVPISALDLDDDARDELEDDLTAASTVEEFEGFKELLDGPDEVIDELREQLERIKESTPSPP